MRQHSASGSPLEPLRDFGRNPVRAGRELRDSLHADSAAFLKALADAGEIDTKDRGFRYAMILLLHNDVLIPAIANPALTTRERALCLTRHMLKMDGNFINSMLTAVLLRPALAQNPTNILRVLDIAQENVEHLGNWRSIARIHQFGDTQVRTRCAGLIARYRFEDPAGLERFCAADPRVRANIVEMLWGVDKSRARSLLEAAARDASNRVAGNAWLALYTEGDIRSLTTLAGMLESPDSRKSITAAWIMGQTRDARFGQLLLGASRSEIPELRKAAIASLSRLDPFPRPDTEAFDRQRYDADVVFVSVPGTEAEGEKAESEIWVRVVGPGGEFLRGIRPIDFLVWTGVGFSLEYSVEPVIRAQAVALGIVYPAGSEALTDAFRKSLSVRSGGQRWAMTAYERTVTGDSSFRSAATAMERYDRGARPQFESDHAKLEELLEGGTPCVFDATEAVRNTLGLEQNATERHLILILDDARSAPEPEAIRELCREKGVRFHCWRFTEEESASPEVEAPSVGSDEKPAAEGRHTGPARPAGKSGGAARRFWEIDEEKPVAGAIASAEEPGETALRAGFGGADREDRRLGGIVRTENQCALAWPQFVAALESRYVLRTKKTATAVAIRNATAKPVRFSRKTSLLKGARND